MGTRKHQYIVIKKRMRRRGPENDETPTSLETSLDEMTAADALRLERADEVVAVVPGFIPLALIPSSEPLNTEFPLEGNVPLKDDSEQPPLDEIIAILDTGIDRQHAAFATTTSILGRSFVDDDEDDVSDGHGHGTYCAGIICGGVVDGSRIGVVHGLSKLVVGKVFSDTKSDNFTLMRGLAWALEQGASIISVSLSVDFCDLVSVLTEVHGLDIAPATSLALHEYRRASRSFDLLASYLREQGVLIVAASGNESKRPHYTIDPGLPAASEDVIAVGAIDQNHGIAPFSNSNPDVVGPGVGVQSAKAGGGLMRRSGTSAATAYVAGVAALWRHHLRSSGQKCSPRALERKLCGSALSNPDWNDADFGHGLVRPP